MSARARPERNTFLRAEIARLAPWHLKVEVTPEISTSPASETEGATYPPTLKSVAFLDARQSFQEMMNKIYPDGLAGRTFLDCACNCGGYSFWAKELGARECFGFDVRKHWIDQARFLAQNRDKPSDGIRFEVCDLYDLPKQGLAPFDISLFKGIFYHLPDPISGLKMVADLTKELLIVNTDIRLGFPDGMLWLGEESTEHVMSGVYGLRWMPTGPKVVERILAWLGFTETHSIWWKSDSSPARGRTQILAARSKELGERFQKP
jgi:SAM-dependent methyltransferase